MDALLTLKNMEDIKISNDTKIQYIIVCNKIYKVKNIDFCNLKIEAEETDISADDIPENELWDILYFKDFHVKLINRKGKAEIIDMKTWIEEHGL